LGNMLTDCMQEFEIMSIANMNQLFVDFEASPLPTPLEEKSSYISKPFSGKALIDSGAMSCFISPRIVEDFRLRPKKHATPKKLRIIDSREVDPLSFIFSLSLGYSVAAGTSPTLSSMLLTIVSTLSQSSSALPPSTRSSSNYTSTHSSGQDIG
jgi:hypothetical protein